MICLAHPRPGYAARAPQFAIGLLACLLSWILAGSANSLAAAEPAAVPADHAARMQQGLALFREHVRPLLTNHCLDCHGGKSTKADFSLATRESLFDSGHIDDTADTSYFFLLAAHEEEPFMPLNKPKLSEAQLAHLRDWIELGAPYDKPLIEKAGTEPAEMRVTDADRQFWSVRPLANVEPPKVENEAWIRTPIDRFIAARLTAKGLTPNEEAPRRTLIRRATFDLLGLPPTPEEVEAFLADEKPDAYERLIDRLLASPHYGERWARHWMDVARFAESHGYEQDYDRPNAYHYRDFLIRAFNDDLPYNTFIRWQLAGDELEPQNPLALTATGFLGGGPFPTQLTEMEFESARYDELDDMTATTGVAFLGLSVGCARCHDHKFDPIPTRDYYRFAAAFTTAIRTEVELDLASEENAGRRAEHERQIAAAAESLARYEREELPAALTTWLKENKPDAAASGGWEVLAGEATSSGGTPFASQTDGSLLAQGAAPAKEVITFTARTEETAVRAIRLEALADKSLPRGGPGRAPNGNFALGDFRVTAKPLTGEGKPVEVKFTATRATHQQNNSSLSIAASIDGDPISGWAVDGQIGRNQAAVFAAEEPFGFAGGTELTIVLTFNHPNTKHALGRFRFSVGRNADAAAEVGEAGPPAAVLKALELARKEGNANAEAWNTALDWFKTSQPRWNELNAAVAKLRSEGPKLALAKAMITSEGLPHLPHHADGRGFPHFYAETHLLKRGDVHQKQEVVESGYLQFVSRGGMETEHWRIEPPANWNRTSFRRASLANWLTDPEYGAGHLAARVMVNRLWQHHFGRGIVATPNDFGVQAEPPTHPELLDWLAADLIAGGWRLKRLHKQIMLSAVYRQSSKFDEVRATIDRENQLHWRRTPRRLEAEAIRDSLLAVSGRLDTRMYGPGTLDSKMRRRSVYFFIKRSQLIPEMMLFDWPEHLVSIGARATTTTATQALAFMNSPQGRAAAEGLAGRLPQDKPQSEQIGAAYELAFSRAPSPRELEAAAAFLIEQVERHRTAGKPNPERLALYDYCQALLSMNEFIYVD